MSTTDTITPYEIACGYVGQTFTPAGRYEIRLLGDGAVHIKVRDERLPFGLAGWETYETITEARRAARRALTYYTRQEATDAPAIERAKDGTPAPWAHPTTTPLEIGDRNRDGTLEVADIGQHPEDYPNTYRVTVRELYGHHCEPKNTSENARKLARRAIPGAYATHTIRTHYCKSHGSTFYTFKVYAYTPTPA